MALRVGVITGAQSEEIGGGWTFAATLIDAIKSTRSSHQFFFIDEFLGSHDYQNQANGLPTYLPTTLLGRLEKAIAREELDLIWYMIQNALPVSVPFIATVWDLEHRKQPYFPEVSVKGWTWTERESYYSGVLPRAAFILTGTEQGKKEIVDFYCVNPARIAVIPLPTPRLDSPSEADIARVMQKHGITGEFLLYPAQFWPHKNHVNLLRALDLLRNDHGVRPSLVLTGSDQGNREHVRELINVLHLSEQVFDLGFIPRDDLTCLYASATALVYPSFFGPDNLPPLEAFALGCPVVAADLPGAREQLGRAPLYFNPADSQEIAAKIAEVLDNKDARRRAIEEGVKIARQRTPNAYVSAVCALLDKFEPITRCWSHRPPPVLTEVGLSFARGRNGVAALVEGWGAPEDWGTWSVQNRCTLRFNVGKFAGRPLSIAFVGRTFRFRHLLVGCYVEDGPIQLWKFAKPKKPAFGGEMTEEQCRLQIHPSVVPSSGNVSITFLISNPASPAERGLSADSRKLGIGLEHLSISVL